MDVTDVRDRLLQFSLVDKTGNVVQFKPNEIQQYLLDNETPRKIVVKPRQVGASTLELGKLYGRATSNFYVNAVLISHEREATRRLFKVLKRFHEMLPEDDRPEVDDWNKDTIVFPKLGSTIYVGTAGARKFGRGDAIHLLHASEVAFWENADENLTAVLQSVPADGFVTLESTPNGASGKFWEMYMEAYHGNSPYRAFFFPWWRQSEYQLPLTEAFKPTEDEKRLQALHHLTAEQIVWRRFKQSELRDKFPQEYPEDPVECFLMSGGGVFDANVLREMNKSCREPDISEDDGLGTLKIWQKPIAGANYVIGADCGEGHQKGDLSAAAVLEHQTARHVATLHGRWHPDEFAAKLDKVGRLYNDAYLGVERNGPGFQVLTYLETTIRYPNLHYRETSEDFTGWEAGWLTTFVTKPIMVGHMEQTIRRREILTSDSELLAEARNYRRVQLKTQSRYEAGPSGHDDLLMAYIIALEVRTFASFGQRAAPRRVG